MKRSILFTALVVLVIATSCVSKRNYDEAEADVAYWKNQYEELYGEYDNLKSKYTTLRYAHEELCENHEELCDNHEELVNKYNDIYNEYIYFLNLANEKEHRIASATLAIRLLRSSLSYDSNDLDWELRRIENSLNGCL